MNDLISRQAAIDALCEMRCGCVLSSCPLTLDKDGTEECADVRCLMDLPSAQPEPCEDAVSRQQVLEEFAELFMICNETLPNENGHRYVVEKELLITQKHIEKLPSVTPKAEQTEIIRCKDCKHRPTGDGFNHRIVFPDNICPCQCTDDEWYSWAPKDDWFCAEAERREE